MRPIPIFDTNIFVDVQRALISQTDWRNLLRHRPSRGWPLSQITALELLAGVHFAGSDGFPDARRQIEIAYSLSNGRILEDPRALLCREVLHIPFPPHQLAPAASTISKYMDAIRRATTLDQLIFRGVPYKGGRVQIGSTSVLADLMAGPKRQWVPAVERMADERFRGWREHFQTTGRRLPPDMRKKLEPRSAWLAERSNFIDSLLGWLHASTNPEVVDEISMRLDAVIEFAIFVARLFLLRNYNLEKHNSDVFDMFQLQYLAMDRFVIVSEDSDLSKRTSHSLQADRIMSLDRFLQTL